MSPCMHCGGPHLHRDCDGSGPKGAAAKVAEGAEPTPEMIAAIANAFLNSKGGGEAGCAELLAYTGCRDLLADG